MHLQRIEQNIIERSIATCRNRKNSNDDDDDDDDDDDNHHARKL